ncbi:MAG: membrane protein insertase YidC [Acidobacteriota bacterium]
MERRALLAVGLSLAVLFAWQMLFPQPESPQPPAPAAVAEVADGGPPAAEPGAEPRPVAPDVPGAEAAIGAATPEIVRVETDDALVVFTNKGARILSWKLKTYKDSSGDNLELVPGPALQDRVRTWNEADLASDTAALSGWLPLAVQFPRATEQTDAGRAAAALEKAANAALYRIERQGTAAAPEVVMTWADGTGDEVVKTVHVGPGFLATVKLSVRDSGGPVPAALAWGAGFGETFKNGSASRFSYRGQALVDALPKPVRKSAGSLDPGERILLGENAAWGGLEDTYFAALLLPATTGRFDAAYAEVPAADGGKPTPGIAVSLMTPGDGTPVGIYVGPKNYQLLRSMGRHLEEVVYFQSRVPLVTPLTRGLFHALIYIQARVVSNWGWAIVLLTFVINGVMWPIRHRSMLSMKRNQEKMKRVHPLVQRIRDRHRKAGKKDIESRQKMNQEVMDLYKKEGINPASNITGCLPLLLQMPVLLAFYNLLEAAIELRQAPFILWIHDLASMDPYYVLPIVMGGSMIAQQVLSGAAMPDPMQRRMMYLSPLLFTFFFLKMPAGLVVYWLVNNLLGLIQRAMINKRHAREAIPAGGAGRRATAGRKA